MKDNQEFTIDYVNERCKLKIVGYIQISNF